MEKMYPRGTVSIEYKVDAVVDDDSNEFAKQLERALNLRTQEGFSLFQEIQRPVDNGLVVVWQKVTQPELGAMPGFTTYDGDGTCTRKH